MSSSRYLEPILAGATLLGLALTIGSAQAATILSGQITNNANSGISSANSYTHKIDFASAAPTTATTVNGVTFDYFGAASDGTLNLTYNGGGDTANANSANISPVITDSVVGLFQGFLHQNGSNSGFGKIQTLTLSGLTAGTQYDFRIYGSRWSTDTNSRASIFTFDPDGAGVISDVSSSIDQDSPTALGLAAGNAFYISYTYTAVASQNLVVSIKIDNTTASSWHLYALTNQVVIPEPSSLILCILSGLLFLRRQR